MENREKAVMLENKIGEIVKYHNDVAKYADFLTSCFSRINSAYRSHLMKLSRVLASKNSWNDFTKVEKQIVENCVLLTRLLTEMCKIQIIIKRRGDVECVNEEGVKEMQDKAFTILSKLVTA